MDAEEYYSSEHYYQESKAALFGDSAVVAKMRATKSPSKHKQLGSKVSGFDQARWDAVKEQYMLDACWAKFTQHDYFKERLLGTRDVLLAEASPTDLYWGIGLGRHDVKAFDPSKWRGKNRLGHLLMRIRKALE